MKILKHTANSGISDYGLWTYLDRARFAIYRMRELELSRFDFTPEQAAIINLLLARGGSATIKQIEDMTMRQHHSITALINRMLKTDYVSRQRNSKGRGFEIKITRKGQELFEKVPITSFDTIFSIMQAKEKKHLADLLVLLLGHSRDLLGLSYVPPVRKYFDNAEKGNSSEQKDQDNKNLSNFVLWRHLDRTRFAVYRIRELELVSYNLTPEQAGVLNLLSACNGSITTKKIEEITMRQHHSISTLVNRMLKTNYISKQKSSHGRGFEITLTPAGKEFFESVPAVSFGMIFSVLQPEDKKQLADYLVLLLERTRQLLGYSTPFELNHLNR